jgi:hypothetical protein
MEGVFKQFWAALDRILPFLDAPWRQIVGIGVPTVFLLLSFYLLVKLALQPSPKTASTRPASSVISAKVSAISSFLRRTFPTRLNSGLALQGTEAITRELVLEVSELRGLKFQVTANQYASRLLKNSRAFSAEA